MNKRYTYLVTSICAALLNACGGGSSSSDNSSTTTVSGKVADGYLAGVTVCMDTNQNATCDPGEPTSSVSDAEGTYTISDVPEDVANTSPIVAMVPASAMDSDLTADDPNATVGKGYVLMAPPGRSAFVSPLSTWCKPRC
jgi:hypothetical protein